MPDPRDVLPVLGWWCAVLVAAVFGFGALRALLDWRAERAARAEAREAAEAREQAHADALTWDAIITAAYTRGHEHGRVSGRRIGYDAGHADGTLERLRVTVQARREAPPRMAPVRPAQRLGRPLDAICGARAALDDDEVCVREPGHAGIHRSYCGGAWGHDARKDASHHHPPAPPPGFNDSEGDEG